MAAQLSPQPVQKLQKAWTELQNDHLLAQAVEEESRKRATDFLAGVRRYQELPFTRNVEEPPTVCTVGCARLLDYGADNAKAPVVFLIPSLINRYYILDLTQKLSFARYLRAQGARVFIVDWGTPSKSESHYNSALYVTEILVPMAEWIRENTKGEVTLGGYCMGGLLALALACIRKDLLDNIAFFATPWDFSVPTFPRLAMQENEVSTLSEYINARDELPAEFIQMLFHYANPYAFQNKLQKFATMDSEHPATQDFLAIEHWVNDGVAMTRGVAQDCLISWTQLNQPAQKLWRVGGQVIDPTKIKNPAFVAVPQDDKIVPSECALPLAKLLTHCCLIEPSSGHVGMMTGSRRKSTMWEPFSQWLFS